MTPAYMIGPTVIRPRRRRVRVSKERMRQEWRSSIREAVKQDQYSTLRRVGPAPGLLAQVFQKNDDALFEEMLEEAVS